MSYRIRGIDPEPYAHLIGAGEDVLEAANAVRVEAKSSRGYPCRVSLEDAEAGETLILVNHVSQDADTPYRATHAIYIREAAREPAEYIDTLPPVFANRPLSLRGFDDKGMLVDAALAMPGDVEAPLEALLADDKIAYIDAHNAAHGCFAARIERIG
ncbi:MAG: DUF1203 domain-containing protein [Sphingomonadaceae bacterium]|nr:DUF1203 domain-containing protein [Sphingomonadaceae bacterium]